MLLRKLICGKLRLQKPAGKDIPVLIYWAAMYGFCAAALLRLGIAAQRPWYFALCLLFGIGTLLLSLTGTGSQPEKRAQ